MTTQELRGDTDETRWGKGPGRRRRRRRAERRSPRAGGARPGSEWRAWAEAIDAVFVAVEDAAWSARRVAELAEGRIREGREELRAAGEDLAGTRTWVARFGQTGWTLASIAAGYRFHGLLAAFVSERK